MNGMRTQPTQRRKDVSVEECGCKHRVGKLIIGAAEYVPVLKKRWKKESVKSHSGPGRRVVLTSRYLSRPRVWGAIWNWSWESGPSSFSNVRVRWGGLRAFEVDVSFFSIHIVKISPRQRARREREDPADWSKFVSQDRIRWKATKTSVRESRPKIRNASSLFVGFDLLLVQGNRDAISSHLRYRIRSILQLAALPPARRNAL